MLKCGLLGCLSFGGNQCLVVFLWQVHYSSHWLLVVVFVLLVFILLFLCCCVFVMFFLLFNVSFGCGFLFLRVEAYVAPSLFVFFCIWLVYCCVFRLFWPFAVWCVLAAC